ncbi:hypothetical protein [Nitratireductor sp. CH_MIT9313-5]|uniref:hypothetical protein n=1 Tax=Nitratireductor sp. CH_MIT9313-5 TaxID=3107764 RepID=UPI00300A2E40
MDELADREVRFRISDIALMLVAVLPALGVGGYGHFLLGVEILDKGAPDFSLFGLAKTLAAILAAMGIVLVGTRLRGRDAIGIPPFALPSISGSMLFLLATALAVILVPRSLNHFVRELQPLSVLTEVVLVGALVFLVLSVSAAWRTGRGMLLGINGGVIHALLSGAVFLILMEETSWGQHWIGFGTPEAFKGNLQNETNLHNFYTYRFELVYYSAAVLAFVLLPAFWPKRLPQMLSQFGYYVPPTWFALFALPVCGLMYESWNIIPYQIWFFCGLLTAVVIGRNDVKLRMAALIQAALLMLSQLVFLTLGHNMEDGYELSEVREFFISVLIAGYALITWRRATGEGASASST